MTREGCDHPSGDRNQHVNRATRHGPKVTTTLPLLRQSMAVAHSYLPNACECRMTRFNREHSDDAAGTLRRIASVFDRDGTVYHDHVDTFGFA